MLFALVILLSVEAYKETQSKANAEADSILKEFQLATLFPSRDQYKVQSELVCYGRSVSAIEWPVLNDHETSSVVEQWGSSIDSTAMAADVRGTRATASYQLFLEQTLQRQQERRGRLEGADGALPDMVWPILILGAISIVAFVIGHADRGEHLVAQMFQVGVTTVLLSASLLLINALNHPFVANPGKIQPEAMKRAVNTIEAKLSESIAADGLEATLPCDAQGRPSPPQPATPAFAANSTMSQIVSRGKLIVGVSYSTALFGELDPISGGISGFDNDLVKEIARKLGLRDDQIEYMEIKSNERLQVLEAGRADMVVMTLTITPARKEQISFSRPYYVAGQSILVRRNDHSTTGLRDLVGKRVCAAAGTTSSATLSAREPEAILVAAASPGDCLTQLLAGAVDAISSDDVILAGLASENDGVILVGGQFTEEPYGVGIPLANRDMVAVVDGVIDQMIRDGRWGRLYYQYLADIVGLPSVAAAKQRLLDFRQ